MGLIQPSALVIRGGAIGDFILTLPAIRLLRENLPLARIEVLGYPGICDLAKLAGLADATRSLEHRTMAPLFAPGAKVDPALKEWLCSFNLVVSYLYDPDGNFRTNMESLGVKTFIQCSHRVSPEAGPASAQLAKPLESLAMYLDDPAPRISLPISDPSARQRIVCHIGSGSETKNWPLARWRELCGHLTQKYPHHLLTLITGEAEAARGMTAQIQSEWCAIPHEHWDSLPLTELATRITGSRAFLGHDSGISHLAASCGVPSLLLFGPTDPAVWAPATSLVKVLTAPGGDLSALSVETVLAQAQAWLG
ncbi:MAG: glycosyltransferase family 9 protein [Verrucomicrobiaceae bacterium]|nr:glycosyltransferase family 9 protein [Verrucomicrobiaceae bacterium]